VLESTTDSVYVLDREWRFAYLNGRARERIAGGRNLVGAVLWEVFPEAPDTGFWVTLHACEAFYRPLQAWFEASAYPIEAGIAVFLRDISARKKAEAERETLIARLEYEHALLDAVIQQMPVGVLVAEAPGGKIILHNETATGLLGHSLEVGGSGTDDAQVAALHPGGAACAPEDFPIRRALARGQEVDREALLYRRDDGSISRFIVSARPVRDERGKIVAAVGVFEDVTGLQDSIERHRLALAAADMGDWRWDAASDLMSFSERALEIFGFAKGEAVTRTRLRGCCNPTTSPRRRRPSTTPPAAARATASSTATRGPTTASRAGSSPWATPPRGQTARSPASPGSCST
jgi:PAS domain S-box-containing protein